MAIATQSWVGKEFELSAQILRISLIPLIVQIPVSACGCIEIAYGKVKLPSILLTGLTALKLVLCLVLVKFFSLGLLGIAWGGAVPALLLTILFTPFYCCRILKISLIHYGFQAFLRPLAWAFAVTAVGLWAAGRLGTPAASLEPFHFLTALVTGGIYAFGIYAMVLDTKEKTYVRQSLLWLARLLRNSSPENLVKASENV